MPCAKVSIGLTQYATAHDLDLEMEFRPNVDENGAEWFVMLKTPRGTTRAIGSGYTFAEAILTTQVAEFRPCAK